MNASLTLNEVGEVVAQRAFVDILVTRLQAALAGQEVRVSSFREGYAQIYVGNTAVTLAGTRVSVTERGYSADQRNVDRIAGVVREQVSAVAKRLGTAKLEKALSKVGRVTPVQSAVGPVKLFKLTV